MSAEQAKLYMQNNFEHERLQRLLVDTQEQLTAMEAAQQTLADSLKTEVGEIDRHKTYQWDSPMQGPLVLVLDWNATNDVVLSIEHPEIIPVA